MGRWYLRGSIWWIKYYRAGRPFCESSGSPKESDAVELLKTRVSQLAQGVFTGLSYKKLSFHNLSQDFLTDYTINQRKSLWRAKLSVAHLKGFFGGMKAFAIDTPLMREYIQRRQSQAARNATINRELDGISGGERSELLYGSGSIHPGRNWIMNPLGDPVCALIKPHGVVLNHP
jgi:hypothetical protein